MGYKERRAVCYRSGNWVMVSGVLFDKKENVLNKKDFEGYEGYKFTCANCGLHYTLDRETDAPFTLLKLNK